MIFLIQFTLNFHLHQEKSHLSMKRFPFIPSKDSVPIGIEVVKVIFWWASEWQSVAIFFLKIFLCLITYLLTKLFISCHSGVIDALHCKPKHCKAYREKPVFITGNPCSHYRDPCFHFKDFPVRKLHRENPVFITGIGFAVQHLRKSHFNFGRKFEFRSYLSYYSCKYILSL